MLKQCHGSGCLRDSTYACSCTNPKAYFCTEHFGQHIRNSPGKHVTECLEIELKSADRASLIPRLKQTVQYVKRCKNNIRRVAMELKDSLEKVTRTALQHFRDLERLTIELMTGNSISKENFERIMSLEIEGQKFETEKADFIIGRIERLFDDEQQKKMAWKECNEIIFSKGYKTGLLSIDLETFKLSNLDYSPIITAYCQTCKLTENTYFFQSDQGESYVLNIKEKNYELLKEGPPKNYGGSVLKDQKIYIFGGYNMYCAQRSCDIFDLRTLQWGPTSTLPKGSHAITAALLNKEIILSGYELGCCYSYNDSHFTSILNLPQSSYKIVAEGWIFANSVLYENKDGNNEKWIAQNVNNSWGAYLWNFNVFRKDQFFYFIDVKNSLMRIDTRLKKLEKVNFK